MVEAIRQGDIPGVQLRRRRLLSTSVDEAWRWLSEADRLERWLADSVEVDPGPRGGLRLGRDVEHGVDQPEAGSTLEWQERARWALAYRREGWRSATRLVFEVEARPAGCEISVLQQGFEHLPLSDGLTLWEAFRRRWERALDRLEASLAS